MFGIKKISNANCFLKYMYMYICLQQQTVRVVLWKTWLAVLSKQKLHYLLTFLHKSVYVYYSFEILAINKN